MSYGQYSENHAERKNPFKSYYTPAESKPKKEVYPTGEIAHLWAHQTQSRARNAQGNFYFDGAIIYSYGSHFPIAQIVENKRGERAVLLTTKGYSVTTSGHISCVRGAIPASLPVFNVRNVLMESKEEVIENLKEYQSDCLKSLESAKRARKNGKWHLSDAARARERAAKLSAFYGVKALPMPETTEELSRIIAEQSAKEEYRRKIAEAKRERERKAKEIEARAAWIAGEELPYYIRLENPALLRVDGEEVVTSMGARVPKDHARRLFVMLKKLHDAGKSYQRNGHTIHIGHYAVNSFDGELLKAGCHEIEWKEIERVSAVLFEGVSQMAYEMAVEE